VVLVVIDGLDAAGKSVQAVALSCFLRSKWKKSVLIRVHPSDDNLFGGKAAHFLHRSGKSAHFAAAVYYMLDVLRSILLYGWRKYDYVIFVRYLMGTAYLPSPLHRAAYHFFASLVPTSEFMFFLDVDPEEAARRIRQARTEREMFETLEELERTRRKALALVLNGGWIILDANQTPEEVGQAIIQALRSPLQTQAASCPRT
jgi:dTMP kinase